MNEFNALVLEKDHHDQLLAHVRKTTRQELSAGNVLIQVAYSSVNYKDALASLERGGVVRQYPHIPGIDLSGVVLASEDPRFSVGQKVLATGYALGVSHSGGFSEIAQVPGEWLIPLPANLSLKESMMYGTAGFTAALAITALEKQGLSVAAQPRILVTGASGGVGSLALGMLQAAGYNNLSALSRKKASAHAYWEKLGVKTVLTPAEITPEKQRPLLPQAFDFVIDTVGGTQLESIIPQVAYGGSLALCGNAGGINFQATVLPYILRGVSLLGIDSVNPTHEQRLAIWQRLATDLRPANLADFITHELDLNALPSAFQQLLDGQMTGRNLVVL